MATLAPQTNFNQVVEKINGYILARSEPNELDRLRLEREVDKVKRVAPAEGWLLSAMLAAITWDKEAVLKDACNAIRLSPRDVDVMLASSHCYWLVGMFDQACKLADQALELSPNNADAINAVIENAIFLGEYTKAIRLIDNAASVGVEAERDRGGLARTLKDMDDAKVSENRVQREAQMALTLMADQHVRLHSVRFKPWRNPETLEYHFSAIYVFFGEYDREIALEKAFAEILMDDPEWDPNRLSSEFLAEKHPR